MCQLFGEVRVWWWKPLPACSERESACWGCTHHRYPFSFCDGYEASVWFTGELEQKLFYVSRICQETSMLPVFSLLFFSGPFHFSFPTAPFNLWFNSVFISFQRLLRSWRKSTGKVGSQSLTTAQTSISFPTSWSTFYRYSTLGSFVVFPWMYLFLMWGNPTGMNLLILHLRVFFWSLTKRWRALFLELRRIIGNTSMTVWPKSKEQMMASALWNASLRFDNFFHHFMDYLIYRSQVYITWRLLYVLAYLSKVIYK